MGVVERDDDKGSCSRTASECGRKVVWRLKRGNGGKYVMVLRGMGSEVMSYDGNV